MLAARDRLAAREIAELWDQLSGRAPCVTMASRVLLDALGLGLEQATRAAPDFASCRAFEDWLWSTGVHDAEHLARYRAWRDGAAAPAATAHLLDTVARMDPVLSPGDLAQWERDGYVVLPAAVTAAEASETAAFLWDSQRARPDDPASWQGPRQQGIFVQLFQHASLEPARRSLRVHKAFAQLWGTADLWMCIDRLSFNAPLAPGCHFRAPRLHWDVSLAPPIPFGTQGILYLTDTAANQGALELVPGFHHGLAEWAESCGEQDPRSVDLRDRAITVPASAGDLVIWRHELPHGASPNTADRPRLAQYVNMYSPEIEANPIWR